VRFAERHWFDVGAVLGLALAIWLISAGSTMDTITLILWISLLTLFAHQVEEWRCPSIDNASSRRDHSCATPNGTGST